jgi:hypothetical protein
MQIKTSSMLMDPTTAARYSSYKAIIQSAYQAVKRDNLENQN